MHILIFNFLIKETMKNIILKSMLLLWTVFAVLSCDDLLEEKVYDFISPEQLGDSESAKSQLLTGTYNTIISSFIAPSSYLYLTNMDCDYASGASWAFGNVGAGNVSGFWGKDHLWQGCYTSSCQSCDIKNFGNV